MAWMSGGSASAMPTMSNGSQPAWACFICGGQPQSVMKLYHHLMTHGKMELVIALLNWKGCLPEADGIAIPGSNLDLRYSNPRLNPVQGTPIFVAPQQYNNTSNSNNNQQLQNTSQTTVAPWVFLEQQPGPIPSSTAQYSIPQAAPCTTSAPPEHNHAPTGATGPKSIAVYDDVDAYDSEYWKYLTEKMLDGAPPPATTTAVSTSSPSASSAFQGSKVVILKPRTSDRRRTVFTQTLLTIGPFKECLLIANPKSDETVVMEARTVKSPVVNKVRLPGVNNNKYIIGKHNNNGSTYHAAANNKPNNGPPWQAKNNNNGSPSHVKSRLLTKPPPRRPATRDSPEVMEIDTNVNITHADNLDVLVSAAELVDHRNKAIVLTAAGKSPLK